MYIKVLAMSLILGISIFVLTPTAVYGYNAYTMESGQVFETLYNVNLRQAPSTSSQRIVLINAGSHVQVTDVRDGVWFAVYYNGHNGYVYAEFLSLVNITEHHYPIDITEYHHYDTAPENESEAECEPEVEIIFVARYLINLRPTPSTDGERIGQIIAGSRVEVTDFRDGEWFAVYHNGRYGYVYAPLLREVVADQHVITGRVEMLEWSVVRNIIPKHTPFTVIDVRTGISFQMISFSHGNHADIFPATAADTELLRQAFGGRWSWDTRPVVAVINGRTLAASMSGMPHGGGTGRNNNMNGHVCMHFLNSRTHNGNRAHERDHQAAVHEAYNTASNW